MKTLFINIVCLLFISNSFAQQGTIDVSFGNNGIQKATKLTYANNNTAGSVKKVVFNTAGNPVYLKDDLINIWNRKNVLNDGILDASNSIFATGYTQKSENDNKAICLSKLKYGNIPNSTSQGYILDETFNFDGKLVFDTKEFDEEAIAIKLQSDNKIVVLGYFGTKGVLIRYTTNGYLDRTFNEKGFYTFQIAQNTKPTALEIQQDGKIIVAGNCFNGNDTDFFITRLNTNGSLDTNFGTNGIVIKDVNNHDNTGNAMILANDGAIYIGGKAYTIGGDYGVGNQFSYNFSVFKYSSNGTLFTAASNGILPGAFIKSLSFYQYTSPPTIVPDDEEINCMAYDYINNRIYTLGSAYKKSYDSQYNIITTKTALFGNFSFSLDNNFTLQNSVSFQSPSNYTAFESEVISASIKPSSMVLNSATTPVYAVVKYNNCSTNTSNFVSIPSTSGSTNTFPTACNNNALDLLLSKIIKTPNGYYGLTQVGNYGGDLHKLNANFEIDEQFGINGKIINVTNFEIDNNGKLICTMPAQNVTNGVKILLARFNSNGQKDYTFGTLGEIRTQNLILPFGIHVTNNNDYIVSSYQTVPNIQINLQKINNDGTFDTVFGQTSLLIGVATSGYPSLKSSEDIVTDNLGNLFTIAYKQDVYDIQNQNINLVKVIPSGVLDASFGNNGIVNLVPYFTLPSNKINLIRLNSGKILIYSDKRMIQINVDGTLDTTFGTNGFLDAESLLPDFIVSKIITNGTDYFIGGYRTNGGDSSTIIKINNLGIINTSFATNGFFVDTDTNYLNVSYSLRNMFFDGNDKIVFFGGGIPIKRIN